MNKEKLIWEDDRFSKNPYKLPEGYFEAFPDRLFDRLDQIAVEATKARTRIIRPWMAWVSAIAAILIVGWFGVRTFYVKPLQEVRFQESIALFVDFYGEELHEGQLAGYLIDNNIDVRKASSSEVSDIIQMDPVLAEEYIYESVGF